MNDSLEFFDEEEDPDLVKLLVQSSLYNRRWRNQQVSSWFEPDPQYDPLVN